MNTILLLLPVLVASSNPFSSNVIALTPKNFKQLENSPHVWFVNVCRQSWGYCGRLTPEWEALAKSIKGTAKIAYWDTEQGANTPRLIGQIKGTPTVKLFYPKPKKNKNNKKKIILDYNGAREKGPMKQYVESKMPNFVEKINEPKQYEKFTEKAIRNGLPQALIFSKASSTSSLLKYASTEYRKKLLIGEIKQTKKTIELFKKHNIEKAPAIVIVKPDGETVQYTKGKMSFHKVINFLGKHALKEAIVPKKKVYTPEELEAKEKKKAEKLKKTKEREEKKKVKSEARKKKKVAEEKVKMKVDGDDLDDDEL